MSVVHPGEQRAGFAGVGFRHGQRRAIEFVGHRADAFEHRAKIGHGPSHVFERGADAALDLSGRFAVARPVDFHHLPGFELRIAVGADRLERAARIAAHRQHRVDDEMDGDVHLAEHDADGIHEEGHVRRHHAQQRAMRRGGCIGCERRRDVDEHRAAAAPAPEFKVGECRGRQVRRAMRPQVFLGHAAEEGAEKFPGQRAPRAGHALQCVRNYLLDEREARCGDLAEHRDSLSGRAIIHAAARAHGTCAGPSSTARPSKTRRTRSSVASSDFDSGATS